MPANCHSEALKNIAAMIKLYSESCLHDFKRAELDGHAVRGETEPSAHVSLNHAFGERLISRERVTSVTPD